MKTLVVLLSIMTHIPRRVFAAISRRQHPTTHSAFSRRISLKLSDFCNARDNKADIKNNTQHFDTSCASTKPTQNQVYSRQNHKTNSESSVFKPKSTSHTRDKKKLISKTIRQPQTHWQNNNKHSFKICNK